MARSTFGRLAVNDGKLVSRLRGVNASPPIPWSGLELFLGKACRGAPPEKPEPLEKRDPRGNFRFFENRQKYLLFVHTCSEKRVIAQRVELELGSIHPRPPALRVFDAGVGDGTVLARVMRSMHSRFPHMPFYVGKEISLEDVRLVLDKLPDRLFEHPATVFVLTNMHYAEAPWLAPRSPAAAAGMIWREVALTGDASGDFEAQIAGATVSRGKAPDERRSPARRPDHRSGCRRDSAPRHSQAHRHDETGQRALPRRRAITARHGCGSTVSQGLRPAKLIVVIETSSLSSMAADGVKMRADPEWTKLFADIEASGIKVVSESLATEIPF